MTPLVIPDTCSILNFAVVDRIALFAELLAGRGRWTQAVHHEVDRHDGLLPGGCRTDLRTALGRPYELTAVRDIVSVENGNVTAAARQRRGVADYPEHLPARTFTANHLIRTEFGNTLSHGM